MIKGIIKYPCSLLYEKSKDVTDFSILSELLSDMGDTLHNSYFGSVGIAAVQIGVLLNIFVINTTPIPELDIAFINPKITKYSDRKEKQYEECLSLPGYSSIIERAYSIDFEYQNRNGEKKKASFTDQLSRIFQHEYDHLNGILIRRD